MRRDVFTLRNAGHEIFHRRRSTATSAGRFGLNATEIQDALRVWVDGRQLGIVLEGSVRTPLFIRGEERLRASAADLARVPIVRPNGGTVELSQVADIQIEDGPIQIIREDGQRFATVLVNVRGRDLVGFVDEAKAAVAASVKLQTSPQTTRSTWGGQFENQQRAAARLAIVLPIALGADFPAALPDLRLGAAGDAGVLQRAVRDHRRHHRAVGVGRISLGAGLGRIYRADRHRGAQRRRDDFLHQRSRRSRDRCRSARR